MSKRFDPNQYTEVKDRIKWYKEDNPDFRIETQLLSWTENHDSVIVKAYVYKNREDQEARTPHGTGIAEELRDAGFVNKTSHIENAETSAIGRALANIDYSGSDKRPSKEEMDKVERTTKAKSKKVQEEVAKKPKEKPKKKETTDDVLTQFDEFDNLEDFVMWFNGLENREEYLPQAQAKIAELQS